MSLGSKMSRRSVLRGAAAGGVATMLARPVVARRQEALSGKVSMWAYPLSSSGEQGADEAMWQGLADAFREEHPDVEVSVEVLPWGGRNEKLTTALAANANPDVAYLNDDFIPQHAGDGNIIAVDDVIEDDRDDFLQNAIDNLSLDGSLYAVPILTTVTTTLYNKNLFDQIGVSEYPGTWEEMLALGPQFRDAGVYLTSYMGSLEQTLNLTYFPLLWQAGGEVLNADGTAAAFNSPEGQAALDFVVTLIQEGYADESEAVTLPEPGAGLAMEGKVGVLMTGEAGSARRYTEAWGEGAVVIGAPLENAIQTSYGTTAGFSIFKNAENVDAAKAWVDFITQPARMETILRSGGFITPRASMVGMYADDPILSEIEQYADLMHSGVHHPAVRQIISAVGPHIQAAFLGQASSADALAAAEQEVNRLIERG
jgi:multiple sugar transport system substrate-binding protein